MDNYRNERNIRFKLNIGGKIRDIGLITRKTIDQSMFGGDKVNNITGMMVYYYFVCRKKLWYYSKGLSMEHNSSLVSMGKLIDETSYKRERKSILIDEKINIDFLDNWKILHEVKKSRRIEEASEWQVKYYIWVLKNKNIEIEKGIIDYPEIKEKVEVLFTEEDSDIIKDALIQIVKIKDSKHPPQRTEKNICKKCSYYELCYI